MYGKGSTRSLADALADGSQACSATLYKEANAAAAASTVALLCAAAAQDDTPYSKSGPTAALLLQAPTAQLSPKQPPAVTKARALPTLGSSKPARKPRRAAAAAAGPQQAGQQTLQQQAAAAAARASELSDRAGQALLKAAAAPAAPAQAPRAAGNEVCCQLRPRLWSRSQGVWQHGYQALRSAAGIKFQSTLVRQVRAVLA